MSDAGRYPRVLVVDCTPFCRHANNGIVKSNLFQGWPKRSLAQIVYANVEPGLDVCDQYWRLTKSSILLGSMGLKRDQSWCGSGVPGGTPRELATPFGFEGRPGIERLLSRLSSPIRVPLGEAILRLPSVDSGPLAEWVRRFSPELIFTMGGLAPILRLAARIARSARVPLIPYFTDDWVRCIYPSGPFHTLLRGSFVYWFKRSLELSTLRITVSDAMSQEYRQRYGGRFETFGNLPERFETTEEPERRCVRLCFIGSLSPNRWQTLRSIGNALSRLRDQGTLGELVIYSFPDDLQKFGQYLEGCDAIVIGGTAAPSDVRNLQLDANILVHVESFDEASRVLTRYSLSTKIPQYLMAGRCVLAVGPHEAASVSYIADAQAGIAVFTNDPAVLCTELEKLLTTPSLRRRCAAHARKTALTQHDAARGRERFRTLLAEVSAEPVEWMPCGHHETQKR